MFVPTSTPPLVITITNDTEEEGGEYTFEVSIENINRIEAQIPELEEPELRLMLALSITALRYFCEREEK